VPTRNQDHLRRHRRNIVATYRKYALTLAALMIQKHVLQLRIEAIARTMRLLEHESNTALLNCWRTLSHLHITCDAINLLLGIGLIVTLI
jgi:hypothetical protein